MYHNKYLKYKNKYLKLQHNLNILNQNGGGTLRIINHTGDIKDVLDVEDSIIRQIPSANSTQVGKYEITKSGPYYRISKNGTDTKYNYSFELKETPISAPKSRLQLTTSVVSKQPQPQPYPQPYSQLSSAFTGIEQLKTTSSSDKSQMHTITIKANSLGMNDTEIQITNAEYSKLSSLQDYDIMELTHDDKKYFIVTSMIPHQYLIVSEKGSRQFPNTINLQEEVLSSEAIIAFGEKLQQLTKDYPIKLTIMGYGHPNNDLFYLNISQIDWDNVNKNPTTTHLVEVYDFTSNYHGRISIIDRDIISESNLFLFDKITYYYIINAIELNPTESVGYGAARINDGSFKDIVAYSGV